VFGYLFVIMAPFGTVFGYFWLKESGNPGTAVGYAVGRNCWARPWGLQKIVYFNWGSTCRKVRKSLD